MLVPIICGSDKTTVTVATGQAEYYLLYLSIGNLHNNVRQAHRGGLVLIAFLAIAKSKYFVNSLSESIKQYFILFQLIKNMAIAWLSAASADSYFIHHCLIFSHLFDLG